MTMLAARLAAALAVAYAAIVTGSAGAANLITVKAPTVLQMAGSDIYCTVIEEGAAPAVAWAALGHARGFNRRPPEPGEYRRGANWFAASERRQLPRQD